MIAVFLLILFIIRICRWLLFKHSALAGRYLYYLYYVSFIAMPMHSLSAAYCVSRDEQEEMPLLIRLLRGVTGILICGVLTNDLHHFVLGFGDRYDGNDHVSYHWLYYVIFVWSFAATLNSFVILIKKCKLSQCRRKWYIPIIPPAAALILIIIYYCSGGNSPSVNGVKLYNIQEVYLILYLGLWEGCITIGLIPSNTGYNRLFERTHINAEMKSTDGKTVYYSAGYSDTEGNADFIRKTSAIKGGSVTWSEDISALNRLNREIEDVTGQIEDENILIKEENRITAEKVRYETKNRLYDDIARHTRPQLLKIDRIMNESGELDKKMERCLLLGTYVKRCSNLMLVASECSTMSTNELCLSIRESLEQTGFPGIVCELTVGGERELPSGCIIAAYDVFEAVIEDVMDSEAALSVKVCPSDDILLSIETDQAADTGKISINESELTLNFFTEDEIQHIILSTGGAVNG